MNDKNTGVDERVVALAATTTQADQKGLVTGERFLRVSRRPKGSKTVIQRETTKEPPKNFDNEIRRTT